MALPENYEDTPNMWRLIIIFPIDLYELFEGNSTFFWTIPRVHRQNATKQVVAYHEHSVDIVEGIQSLRN